MICMILLVRNHKLDEKYSILWLFFSIVIVILVLGRGLLEMISTKLGIYYAPATLFLIGMIFIIIFIIHLSTVVTKQNQSIIRLVQKLALLEQKVKEKEKKDD